MIGPLVRPEVRALVALLSGLVFGIGLSLAQMIDPRKVLGFLDVSGAWDASLMFVLGGAVGVAAVGFHFVRKLPAPLFDDHFHLPTLRGVDRDLLLGSALFGMGWGLAGYCPGPAIASLGFGNEEALWFLPALAVGTGLQRWQAYRALRALGGASLDGAGPLEGR